jgi:Asp-tRNA(Asn)/Glu-tRNA(Gln) amidotransferase A subunit family amidase
VDAPVPDFTSHLDQLPPKLRIGVPRAFFFYDLNPEITDVIEKAIQVFHDLHAQIRNEVRLEVSTDRTLASAEAYAFHQPLVARSPELYQSATLARIKSGESIAAADALRAGRDLQAGRHAIRKIFDEVDILLTPTVPILPPSIKELGEHPDRLRPTELNMLRNTRPFNVWGIPAISIPCGLTKGGLPIGVQLAAAPWQEHVVLQAAQAYEQATDWHMKMPDLPRTT